MPKTHHNTIAPEGVATTWADMAAQFRAAHAHVNRQEIDEVIAEEMAAFYLVRDALYEWPVATLAELEEKVALIREDDGDERGFAIIADDIERLANG